MPDPVGPGHEHQSLVEAAQLQDVRRQSQIGGRQDLRRNHPKDGAAPFPIHEDVGAEPRKPGDLVREVSVVPPCELLAVLPGHDRLEQGSHRCRVERRRVEFQQLD